MQSNRTTKGSNSALLVQRLTAVKCKMSLESQREPASEIHLTHNMEFMDSSQHGSTWKLVSWQGCCTPLQYSVWKWGMIIRTSNWIAEVEKLEGISAVASLTTKSCCLTDWITAHNGRGLKPCKWSSDAVMKAKLSDQRLTAHKEENLTGDQM